MCPQASGSDSGERTDALPPDVHAWLVGCGRSGSVLLEPLAGGAGARRYWRARFAADDAAVLMHAVPEAAEILPPALRTPTAELPFLTVTKLLRAHDLPTPEIFARYPAAPAPARWLLLEDLGERRLYDLGESEREPWREQTVDLLARLHAIEPRPAELVPFGRHYDVEWIEFELALFVQELPAGHASAAKRPLRALAEAVAGLPRSLCLRDCQSQNLMIDARERLRVIDYQDALLAPRELDLVSFLLDAYAPPSPSERGRLLARYAERSGVAHDADAFALLTLVRKCKDLSRYRMLVRRGEARFGRYLEGAAHDIREALPRADAVLPGSDLRATLDAALGALET